MLGRGRAEAVSGKAGAGKGLHVRLTITAARSPINQHVIRAGFGVLKHYRQVRDQTTMPRPFLMRVIDTRMLFAGSAPATMEATRLFQSEASPAAIRERLTLSPTPLTPSCCRVTSITCAPALKLKAIAA